MSVKGRPSIFKFMVNKICERRNLTQAQVAREIDMPASTFNDWTGGTSPRDLQLVDTLANYFKVKADYLIWGSDDDQVDYADELERIRIKNQILELQNKKQLDLFIEKEKEISELKKQIARIERSA